MVWHPLLMTISAMDLFILLLLLKAGLTALKVVFNWAPDDSGFGQLQLERDVESADIMTQWAFMLMMADGLLWVVAVTRILPRIIPGAMCGMGVMQALDNQGPQLVMLRFLVFCVLYWQRALARLNCSHPLSPLTVYLARMELLALIFWSMTTFDGLRAVLFHLDTTQPVSCCAVIYDDIESMAAPAIEGLRQSSVWPVAFGLSGCILSIFCAKSLLRRDWKKPTLQNGFLAILGEIWTTTAGISLIYFFTPYIYQVLGHHCPFCLFLPEHYGIGFFLLGLLVGANVEMPLPFILDRIQVAHPELTPSIQKRRRRSLAVVLTGVLGFSLLTALPALLWRSRFGVWI